MILLLFAQRYLPGVQDFVNLVQHNANKAIASGTDPREAYEWALKGSLELVEEKANQQEAALNNLSPPSEVVDGRLTLTLGKLLDPKTAPFAKRNRRFMLDGVHRNVVYVVRDGESVLYVGCTKSNARRRLREHVSGKSVLGQAIKRERPRSNNWTAEMISHADIKTALETEKRLTEQYKPRYCAAYAAYGE